MSVLIDSPYRRDRTEMMANRFAYPYPNGLNLQPDADQHGKIVNSIMRRAYNSHSQMKKRHCSWDEIDRSLTAYIPTDKNEQASVEKDERKPVSIVLPISYMVLQTLLTHLTRSYLVNPLFRYEGQGPEDHVGAILLEKVVDSHVRRFGAQENIYYMWRDMLAYGFGGVSCIWERETVSRTGVEDTGFYTNSFGPEPTFWPTGKKRVVKREICEGNRLVNIDPRRYLPDPNVPVHAVQTGEYVGWVERTNIMRLKAMERQGELFNVKYVQALGDGRSKLIGIDDSARDRDGLRSEGIVDDTRPVDVVWKYIRLIPKEWGLGGSDEPEMWLFAVAGDLICIKAERLDANHGRFPIAVAAPNADGHSISPISTIETTYGCQKTVDFLNNSHTASRRKLIKNLLVYDPSQINAIDMEKGKSMVRARKRAFGTPLKDAIFQVPMNDVTQSHMTDIAFHVDLIQRVTGATVTMEGMDNNAPERRTGTEYQGMRSASLGRVEMISRMATLQAHNQIAYLFAEHCQQYMTEETYVKTVGRWQEILQQQDMPAPMLDPMGMPMLSQPPQMIPVSPLDLIVSYDILPADSGVNGGEDPAAAGEVFAAVQADLELRMNYDIKRIFNDWARMRGFKNIEDYRLQTGMPLPMMQAEVAPNGDVQDQVQAGNLQPLAGAA